MISAIAAAFEPGGVSAHGILVFRGNQYIGKTKWFKNLCPEELEATRDGVILRPDDKDLVFQCISRWLIELGELDATFNKSDIAQLKAFITKDKDVIRRAYAKKESNYARRTVFFASVNEQSYLSDPTGNRRFWTIECSKINYDHGLDMQQIWAEIKYLYRCGEKWVLNIDEIEKLNSHNEEFQTVDPIEELIRSSYLDMEHLREVTATEVCVEIGITRPTNSDARRAGRAIRKIFNQESTASNGARVFVIPFHKDKPAIKNIPRFF
jgi:putative DNA primase/helicase